MEKLEAVLSGITVNTHSSICISAEGKTVWIDPYSLPKTPQPKADVIFVTHDHFDHFSPTDIERVRTNDTVFVMPPSTAKLAARFWRNRIVTAAPGDRGAADGLCYEAIPAYNPGKQFHPKQNAWLGYVLTVDGLRVYIAGDTDATEEAAAVRCDIALLPIGGTYTMDATEAAALANRLKPQAVVPVHYGSVAGSPADFDRFAAAVSEEIRVCRKL